VAFLIDTSVLGRGVSIRDLIDEGRPF